MLTKIIYLKFSEWLFLLFVSLSMNQFGSLLFETRKSTVLEVLGVSIVAFGLLNLLGLFLLSSSSITWFLVKQKISRLVVPLIFSIAILASIYLMHFIGSQGEAFQYTMKHRLFAYVSIAYGVWMFLTLLFLERLGKF